MKRLYLYDDKTARLFEPFALTRPASELRVGAELTRLRWERVAGQKAYGFIGAVHLDDFDEGDAPPAAGGEATLAAGSVVVNSRFIPSLSARLDDTSLAFACDGEVCAVRIRNITDMSVLRDGTASLADLADKGGDPTTIAGRWINNVWDLVGNLGTQLSDDIPILGKTLAGGAVEKATVIGKNPIYLEIGASVEPHVVLDATDGPILIRRGATVAAFTRIVGPTYIGQDSHIIGDAIRACSIGDTCKVRGEISSTTIIGHSNKGHTGFVGSSYLGRWVNLGAGTTTSNLKNTYGPIQLWTPEGLADTGLQFLGSVMGDHAKTGIGTMLTTGCVVGAGANIYGAQVTPKRIPPFAWGDSEPYSRFDGDKFVEVAERMMSRRHVTLSDKGSRQLKAAMKLTEKSE